MITRIIELSVRYGRIVVMLAVLLAAAGVIALQRLPLDALPDLSDTQVIIRTDFPGQSPQTVEDLVTYPLATTMLGAAGVKDVRGYSMFGTSFLYVIFHDGIDLYWARSRVAEALRQSALPEGARSRLGPDATGVGWVYQYALIDERGQQDLSDLHALQRWYLRYELESIEGVSEVATVGGYAREYQVIIDPVRLQAYGLSALEVARAIKGAGSEVGGRVIEQGETELMIRSGRYIDSSDDLRAVVLRLEQGAPLTVGDVAEVRKGAALRRGVAELNGEGEVVAGIVVMRSGENAREVIARVKARLAQLQSGLPEGVRIVTVHDREPLITHAVHYLSEKLIEEMLAVALVTFLFLGHLRASLVALISLPLGVLAAFVAMTQQGLTADIMALGGIAIAIGAMVDAAIVMVENIHRRLAELRDPTPKLRRETALAAMRDVGPALFTSLLIITVSFLPIFALSGESYRLFSPLAYTKTFAMAASAILSITLVPVLARYLLSGRLADEKANPLNRLMIALYRPVLRLALRFKTLTLLLALAALLATLYPLRQLGSEFMPPLYEEELLYMPTTLPGVSITEAKAVLARTNRLIKTVPEVEQVFGKAGRADTATDPAPISMIETWIRLKPRAQWRSGMDVEGLIRELDARVKLPGLVNSWGYPIKIRTDMLSTGIRTPVGIKITGDDLGVINAIALEVEGVVRGLAHVRSVLADRSLGGNYLRILPDRRAMAQHGVRMETLQATVATVLGGMPLSEAVEGRARYDVILRYDRPYRETPDDLKNVLIPTMDGAQVPLGQVAEIRFEKGPAVIKSENARLCGWVFVDVDDTDLGGFVAQARARVAGAVTLPPGYALAWSGQYEQLQEAASQLKFTVALTLFLILMLLLIHFNRLDRSLMVMLALPFGLIGGIWALYLMQYHLSVAVAVGFIALGGIAVETAVVMLIYLDLERKKRPDSLHDAVINGAVLRLRPKLMTVSVILAGLLPVFLTEGVGADVMRRIALPMLGGMVSTTLLTLIVLPVVYRVWEGRRGRAD